MSFGLTDCLVIFGTLVGLFVWYAWNRNQFFKRGGIKHLKPKLFFGNSLGLVLGKDHVTTVTGKVHEMYPDDKYVGIYNFMNPLVVIKDPDLIKQVTVKDFDHFTDHMKFTDDTADPLIGKILFSLDGERWREMRTTLSPAFTSSKMRGMFPFIIECAEKFVDFMKVEVEKNVNKQTGYTEFNTRDITSRYTNDVIASCAFGYKVDSFNEMKNMFFMMAKKFTTFSLVQNLKVFLFFLFPTIFKALKIGVTEEESTTFFRNLILDTINARELHKIVRPDMIHLLMLAQKGTLKNGEDDDKIDKNQYIKTKWTEEEIVAQPLIFIFAGFDSSSVGISFLLYELAANLDCQKKLQDEIDEFIAENGGKIDYSNLSNLKYLDMVVSESLRLWPPAPFLDRRCVIPYTLPPQNEKSGIRHKMRKGDILWISAYDIQRDPRYFENPDEFIPERFSEENKSKINPNTYLPFGVGPRVCIGSRFALMQIKLIVLYLMANFDVAITSKTSHPIKLKPDFFNMTPKNGFWIGIKKRDIITKI